MGVTGDLLGSGAMYEFEISEAEYGVTFAVRVVPRARKNEVVGVQAGALKVRLTSPPVGGAANEALVKFLAEGLGVRRSQVEIVRGRTSRRKVIKVAGLSAQKARERLLG